MNAKWGNLQAILAGDFLLSHASGIAASLGTEIAGLLANTIGRLCEGQIEELRHTYDTARPSSYFTSIQGKTASLFGTAARIGGIVAGSDRGLVEALTEYGNSFGIVFQIVDDILDVMATEDSGKPAGHDMVEGVYTLPVLRTLTLGRSVSEELGDLLGSKLDVVEHRQGAGDRPLERGSRERHRHGPPVRRRRRGRCDSVPVGSPTDALRSAPASAPRHRVHQPRPAESRSPNQAHKIRRTNSRSPNQRGVRRGLSRPRPDADSGGPTSDGRSSLVARRTAWPASELRFVTVRERRSSSPADPRSGRRVARS